jgi:hypothetical protein
MDRQARKFAVSRMQLGTVVIGKPPTKPVLPDDAPVHFVPRKWITSGNTLCEDIRDLHFGAQWNGSLDRDGDPVTHVAEDGFEFTLLPEHVTCSKCRDLHRLPDPPPPPPDRCQAALDLYLAFHTQADHFNAQLFKLIAKSVGLKRAALRGAFPLEVSVFEEWHDTPVEKDFFKKYDIGDLLHEPNRSMYKGWVVSGVVTHRCSVCGRSRPCEQHQPEDDFPPLPNSKEL